MFSYLGIWQLLGRYGKWTFIPSFFWGGGASLGGASARYCSLAEKNSSFPKLCSKLQILG